MISLAKAIGVPEVFSWKGRLFILHPLTIREWLFIEKTLYDEQDQYVFETALYAIWLSIRKEDSRNTRRFLNRRLARHKDIITAMLDKIIEISLPQVKDKDKDKKQKPFDISPLLRLFAERYGFTSQQVGDMTPIQISIYLKSFNKQEGTAKHFSSLSQVNEAIRKRKEQQDGISSR